MKNTLLLFAILLMANQWVSAQSITLATTTANPTKGTVVYNNGTNQLQYWNGSAWIPVTNAASGTGWALSGTNIYKNNSGNVGIGITNPANILQIGSVGESGYAGNHLAIGNGNEVLGIYQTNSYSQIAASTHIVLKPMSGGGRVGINVDNPTNSFQIGFVGASGINYYDFAIGNGSNAFGIYQANTVTSLASSTDISLRPRNNGNGYVGINTSTPVNRLQIGSMGSTGYNGHDLAIGNGTAVTGFYQTNDYFQLISTAKMLLKSNSGGDVISMGNGIVSVESSWLGVNTTSPRGPLDVMSWSNTASIPYAFFYYNNNNGQYAIGSTPSNTASISIYAEQGVLATNFIAYSDARIKNIVGISNSLQDLAIVRALQITDYTMKDELQYGGKPYKKVIAQQVEKVYPQAVTKVTDIVPDIYALLESVVYDENKKTLTCLLAKNYAVKVGEKLQFIHPTAGKLKAEVIEVSDNSFTVKDWQHPTDKVFVYGREVNDFRSVDYEALSMLGISAIQQLAKENEELKMKNNEFSKKFEQLSARLESIEAQMPKPPTGN